MEPVFTLSFMLAVLTWTFGLLAAFQIKHFLCDYPFQTSYMLGKFKRKGWVLPLAAHAAVHGIGTFAIVYYAMAWLPALACALVDATIHFIVDRIKASPNLGGQFGDKSTPQYWWCLGLDQMVHHLTHYAIIAWIITSGIRTVLILAL